MLNVLQEGHLGGHTRPSATNVLTFCGLIRFWICDHGDSAHKKPLQDTLAFIGLIQYAKFNEEQIRAEGAVEDVAKSMLSTYADYMRSSVAVHGPEWAIAKTHWNWHVILQYAHGGGHIYDSFVVERLHRRAKSFSRPIENTGVFERSVLSRLVTFQCLDESVNDVIALAGRVQQISQHAHVLLESVSQARSTCNIRDEVSVSSGDFIRCAGKFARVVQAVAYGDHKSVRIICRLWSSANPSDHYWDMLSITDTFEAWDPAIGMLVLPLAWRRMDDANFVVLWRS